VFAYIITCKYGKCLSTAQKQARSVRGWDVTADMRNAVTGTRMTTVASPVLRLNWRDTKKSTVRTVGNMG
jgi:hypothetical protein